MVRSWRSAPACVLALCLPGTAGAAVHGITGPTFNLAASAGSISQPDGTSIYAWGYGCDGSPSGEQAERVHAGVLAAYRWQYIVSGVQEPRFSKILGSLITKDQATRIGDALAPIL